ncbi:hypothetical protein [Oleiharenicola sp. Vm1]|uniref:hypothetical protein n=1 Tax=Oleiharenicola sp. Vm1 TaxID=3398393 RepID=UPI0039F486D4
MSLINDALKKAQRQRTGDSPQSQPPMPGGPSAPRRARGDGGLNPQLLLLGAGALLGVLIATGAVFFFRRDRKPEPIATVATPPRPSDRPEAKPAETPASAAPAETAPATAASPARASAAAPVATEPTVVVKPEPVVIAPVLPPAAGTATDAPAASVASGPAAPSLRMIEAIEAFRVAGIRAGAGTDAKVLMNDRVYRIGDTVDHALGIKLTGVTANSLTFRDAAGATYTRNF